MAVVNDVLTVMKHALKELAQTFFGAQNGKSSKVTQVVFFGALLVGIGYGGSSLYRWRVASREAQAQKDFSEAIQLFEQAKGRPEKWEDVAGALALGYEQHHTSSLAPFFKLFQAQAMLNQKKRPEAIKLMDDAIERMSNDNVLLSSYQTKRALVKMDATDVAVQAAGLAELKAVADNANSPAQDVALFYLGMHYWHHDQLVPARDTWKKIEQLDKQGEQSPFALLVQEKLQQIK